MSVAKAAVRHYLNYVKDVLGIKHLFFTGEQVTAKKIVISVADLNTFSESERDLLDKMISALHLDPQSMAVIDSCDIKLYKPEFLLKLSPVIADAQPLNTIETYSPKLLVDNPGLKKQAWSQMQVFLQKIK